MLFSIWYSFWFEVFFLHHLLQMIIVGNCNGCDWFEYALNFDFFFSACFDHSSIETIYWNLFTVCMLAKNIFKFVCMCMCVCGACDWSFFEIHRKFYLNQQIKYAVKDQFYIKMVNQLPIVNLFLLLICLFVYLFWFFFFVANTPNRLNCFVRIFIFCKILKFCCLTKWTKLLPIDQIAQKFWCTIVKIFDIWFIFCL